METKKLKDIYNPGDIIMFTSGEYSDYHPFQFAEATQRFFLKDRLHAFKTFRLLVQEEHFDTYKRQELSNGFINYLIHSGFVKIIYPREIWTGSTRFTLEDRDYDGEESKRKT